MKEKWIVRIAVFLFFVCSFFGGKVSADTASVYDEAGLLTEAEKLELEERAAGYEESYRMNFVVMTVADTGGREEDEYADWFYEQHGYTDNGQKGGAIFYIDMDNRAVGMETNGEMILFMTDRRIEDAIDAAFGYVEREEYGKALLALMDTTAQYIEEGIESGQVTYNEDTGEYRRYRTITGIEGLLALLIAVAAGIIPCVAVAGRYRMKWGSQTYNFRENGELDITLSEESFLGQHVTRRHIPKDPGGGGHGGGGHVSTTHQSSGGHEFGGGSRNF